MYSIPVGGDIGNGEEAYSVVLVSAGGTAAGGANPGPATLTVTTAATQRSGNQFTLRSSAPILVQ